VIVLINNQQVEVATFRSEWDYSDGRRPDKVAFTDPKTDAMRRDFTINGMFYDPIKEEVIDYVGGREDLAAELIRTIGDPQERFGEDYLRMLRAVRFSAQLDYVIEANTWKAIKSLAPRIANISGERIAAELERIFDCPSRAQGIEMLAQSGILPVIFPGISDEETAFGISVLQKLTEPVSLEKGLAAMMIGCPKEKASKLVLPLKLSNRQSKAIGWIFDEREKLLQPDMKLSLLRPLLADERFAMLFDIQRAVQTVENKSLANLEKIEERAAKLKDTVLMPPPLLNGKDVIELGVTGGPQIGKLLRKLYENQLDEIIKTRNQAITAVKKWLAG
jgi:poly(A) polymerase